MRAVNEFLPPAPTTATAMLALLMLTGCQGQSGDQPSAAPSFSATATTSQQPAASPSSTTTGNSSTPTRSQDTVAQWWQALRDNDVDAAMKLQSKPLTEQYYTRARLNSLSQGLRGVKDCQISQSEPRAVDGGEVITTDLTKCKFNDLTHWTWNVDPEKGLLVQSDTGTSLENATDRFEEK